MTNEIELRDYLELVAAILRRTRRCLRGVEEEHAGPVAVVGMGAGGLGPALTTRGGVNPSGPGAADWRYRVTWLSADAVAGALSGTWLLVAPEQKRFRDIVSLCAGAMAGRGARIDTMLVVCGTVDRDVLSGLLVGALAGESLTGVVSFLGHSEATGTLALIQALGDAGIAAPLWLLAHEWNGTGHPPAEFGARAAALLCSVLAGAAAGQAANRPAAAQGGRRRRAAWSAEADRGSFEAADEAARTPAQR